MTYLALTILALILTCSLGVALRATIHRLRLPQANQNSIEDYSDPHGPPIRGAATAGLSLIALFFGGLLYWGGTAPLQSAAVAPGTVNLDTYRKTIQHFEGGIVRKILVREGQEVSKGEVLVQLDETQTRARIDLLEAQLASREKQFKLISEELENVQSLFEKGLTTQSRLLALKRNKAVLEGERIERLAQLKAARDVVDRSRIRAPIAGTVVSLQVHTTGGVIKPGDPLLSIVPQDEPLVIDAQVDPNDIDVIHKNLSAQVRLTPLNARTVPPLPGRIAWISADRMSDQNTGTNYYLARVEITSVETELPEDVVLYPGMPAEVIITTGEHTFFEYLIAPLARSFRRSFRED